MPETYSISTQMYYDSIEQCYKRIYVVDRQPNGPLGGIVKTLHTPKLSPFQEASPCCPINNCVRAIYNPLHPYRLLMVDEQVTLIQFLTANQYTIDTSLTKLILKNPVQPTNQLMFMITY